MENLNKQVCKSFEKSAINNGNYISLKSYNDGKAKRYYKSASVGINILRYGVGGLIEVFHGKFNND